MRIAGSPELGGTRGAQHEDVPEQGHGVQEPSHGVPGGDGECISATRHVGRFHFQFQFADSSI